LHLQSNLPALPYNSKKERNRKHTLRDADELKGVGHIFGKSFSLQLLLSAVMFSRLAIVESLGIRVCKSHPVPKASHRQGSAQEAQENGEGLTPNRRQICSYCAYYIEVLPTVK
jgi:hypothetical protein